MAIRTITAPGVQINEIDKSGYTQTLAGTAVYAMGFSDKGEAYAPVEITTRPSFELIFGTPDTEAERYFYAAACEALNQGGRLIAARLPYDNAAFEKMPGVKYTIEYGKSVPDLSSRAAEGCAFAQALIDADANLNEIALVRGGKTPVLYDLETVDMFRTDEMKVPADTFLIVDKTGQTYKRVVEDDRKGVDREVIGIIPVVTTAANALYVQNYISCEVQDIRRFESIGGTFFKTVNATDENGSTLNIDGYDMHNSGLSSVDLVKYIATDSYYSEITSVSLKLLEINDDQQFNLSVGEILTAGLTAGVSSIGVFTCTSDKGTAIERLSSVANIMHVDENDIAVSCIAEDEDTGWYAIVSAAMLPADVTKEWLSNDLSVQKLEENGYDAASISAQLGWHGKNGDDSVPPTIALDAAAFFPAIQPSQDPSGGLDPEHLKDIGVVVFQAYLDITEGNKVSLNPVEAFAGSLYKDDKDPNTGVTKFIDTIVNSNSKYINFFSNCFSTPAAKEFYQKYCDILIAPSSNGKKLVQDPENPDDPSKTIEVNDPVTGACLGFYTPMTKKDISISKSIMGGINKCFDKVQNINDWTIDIIPDAGIANIASYIKAIFGEKGPYDLSITDALGNSMLGMWKCEKADDKAVMMWKTVLLKYDNFCKNIRKDCMFTADGMRPLVLQGQKKIVRETMPKNSIDKNILPFIKAICGINTSYGAGYADWFQQADDYTGDFFWCPPSIKAMGAYVNTDVNYDYWLAPAGLTRGVVAALDIAFNPNPKQAGAFYEKNWNYAINYPQDGIVLEGQKTFQVKPTALDRVNVRRMMLRLERQVYRTLRYYVYENNTAYTRQRIIDALDPIFKACWQSGNGGLARYKIVCDESINDANTIDNNELKVQIGVVPNKSAEFIICQFIIGSQSSTWEELF